MTKDKDLRVGQRVKGRAVPFRGILGIVVDDSGRWPTRYTVRFDSAAGLGSQTQRGGRRSFEPVEDPVED